MTVVLAVLETSVPCKRSIGRTYSADLDSVYSPSELAMEAAF